MGCSAWRGLLFSMPLEMAHFDSLPYSMVINKVLDLNVSVPLIPLGHDFTLIKLDYILGVA